MTIESVHAIQQIIRNIELNEQLGGTPSKVELNSYKESLRLVLLSEQEELIKPEPKISRIYYYLFGGIPSRIYHDDGFEVLLTALRTSNLEIQTAFIDMYSGHPTSLLLEADGTSGFAEITAEEYHQLQEFIND